MSSRAVCLTACGVILAVTGCSREASDWEQARQTRSVDTLQTFIEKHSDGVHAADALALLVQAQAEQTHWDEVTANGSDHAYRHYIEIHPESRYREQAQSGLNAAVEELVKNFEADTLIVTIDPAVAIWRGAMQFSMNDGGAFTGRLTFVPPESTQTNIAIAVLNTEYLIPELVAGRAYIWRGGTTVIDWKDVSAWDNDNDIATALGFDPDNAYVSPPPRELLVPALAQPNE